MELEIRRNFFHLVCGIAFVILFYYSIVDSVVFFILFILTVISSFLSLYIKIPIFHWFLEKFDRKEDLKRFPGKGSIFYVLGMFIASLFPKDIAMAGIIILALGDSVNSMVGVRGKIKNPFNKKRFIEGFFAGLIAAFIGALFFVSIPEAFIASFIAMVFESVGMKIRINDNLIIPVVACGSIWFLRLIL